MMKLLGRQTSGNVQKVIFALEEIGKPYAREDYGRQFGNTETPQYRALNPHAKIPTLIDGDTVVWESNAILRYLAREHAPELMGGSAAQDSHIDRWMDWLIASVSGNYATVFLNSKKPAAERSGDYEAAVQTLIQQLGLINEHVTGKEFLALDRFTIADIAYAPIMNRCLGFSIGRPPMPHLEAWMTQISERKAFQKAVTDPV